MRIITVRLPKGALTLFSPKLTNSLQMSSGRPLLVLQLGLGRNYRARVATVEAGDTTVPVLHLRGKAGAYID